jgi:NodT family efflux transporter outer membrane factor (OMF) lipoprotein
MLACLALAGCAVGPDFDRPAAPSTSSYLSRGEELAPIEPDQQRVDASATVPARWWTAFRSKPLDEAVQRALTGNGTLRAAEATLRASEETLSAGRGAFYPAIDADVSAERARAAPIVQGSSARGEPFHVLSASSVVTFPLDIFGGRRRAVEGLAAQVDLQRYEAAAARVALTANVVDACIARAGYRAQRTAIAELIALERDQLHSIDAQIRAGTAATSASLTLQSVIAGNEATLAALDQRLSVADHQLAVLLGVPPSVYEAPELDLADLRLPMDVPLSLPSTLVRQRPDILAAEARLHAASAEIGVATAAMFPSFDIAATYGAAGSTLGTWLDPVGRFWSTVPALTAPLFQGGSLWHGRKAAIDAYDAQQATYRQTVVAALGEVADTLTALRHDAQAVRAQQAASDAAREALRLLRTNHAAGLVAYADVLEADVAFHQAAIGLVQAKVDRYQDTVALLAALGGGWWSADAAGSQP